VRVAAGLVVVLVVDRWPNALKTTAAQISAASRMRSPRRTQT
jgi:hypothetical protein